MLNCTPLLSLPPSPKCFPTRLTRLVLVGVGDNDIKIKGLTASLLCMHVHYILGNKMQIFKFCSFFLTSMLAFLHQNAHY